MNEHWKDQLRDERGRWIRDEERVHANFSMEKEAKMKKFRISIQFFGEDALERQTISQMKKGIRTAKNRITEHENYLKNPKLEWEDWDSFDDARKAREINHWKNEIKAFRGNIKNREEEIARREKDHDQ